MIQKRARARSMSAQKPPPPLKRRASNKEGEDLAEPLPADLNLKTASIQLFQFNFSPPCAKVRALLHYYGVPFESVTTQPHQHRDDIDNSCAPLPAVDAPSHCKRCASCGRRQGAEAGR